MRHRRRGRVLGRNPSHQRELLRNLASSLFLTERDTEDLRNIKLDADPAVPGRIVTTVAKAKEVRPLVEKCITIAKKSIASQAAAKQYATDVRRNSEEWKSWRNGERWRQWNAAIAPALAARRRCLELLGDKLAVLALFEQVAPRFVDRPGGYTRIVRLAHPRLGDAGPRAILEFTGVNDRKATRSERPAFDTEDDTEAAETAEPAAAAT